MRTKWGKPVRRLAVADIAREAGVSTGSVSYALNGKPGVAEDTRERILRIAADRGWRPSSAARALTGKRTGAIGLVVDRPARVLGSEPFFMQFVSGVQSELGPRSRVSLMLQVSDDRETELGIYRDWWAERRVDGVLLTDLRTEDSRAELIRELGLPAVAVGPPQSGWDMPFVWSKDAVGIHMAIEHLSFLGHRSVARVAGPKELLHTQERDTAFRTAAQVAGTQPVRLQAGHSGEEAARATRSLLAKEPRPTALLNDNDVMAVAAMGTAREMGFDVPDDLSVIAWDDSPLCGIVRPVLTAVARNIAEHGRLAADALLRVVAGEHVEDLRSPDPVLTPRGTTALAPRG